MDIGPRPAVVLSVVVLVVLAGCLSVGGTGGSDQPTTIPQSGTPTPVQDGCPSGLAFYGLGSPGDYGWSTDEVAVGYTLPADSSALLVVLEDETVLGTTKVSNTNPDYAVAADGDTVVLDDPLRGSHEIRVVAYADSDGDGEFDAGTDAPCHSDGGELVMTGPEVVDFDELAS
ncbi:hypothetical protein [Halobacterium jilantaiense]|uniref:Uncharacterized protein n=1 Tax=Halobacterium jilantaiense TaxID=355548 RepID=A0A1I0NEN1_9EURY|nr:hypothetical protein [Halobacterium jilantaiense]SEV99584.1 hypothetical protein SAMN04487945_0805 [Halobacterium jilantaiense]